MRTAWAFLVSLAALASAGAPPAHADTRTGIQYFKHGMFAEALKELRPEAEKNDPAALYVLGKMHSAGLGVEADAKKAAEFFRRGAELNDPASQNDYGAALALGEGVEQNVAEALKWLMLSSRQGHTQAREYVERLIRYMQRSEVARIRKAAIDWEQQMRDRRKAAKVAAGAAAEPSAAPPEPAPAAPAPPESPPQIDLPLPAAGSPP